MSCIAGIISLDGDTIEPTTLQAMLDTMTPRAPDGNHAWHDNSIGLGHAYLRLSLAGDEEITASNEYVLVADARIDDQKALRERLRQCGEQVSSQATDAQLILHAYHVWGENCLAYLIGDFSFALWDSRQRKLFCARDHLGLRPFFYALTPHHLVLASDLDALLEHHPLSRELNNGFLADFLIFGGTADPALTVYQHMHRLPPAHKLVVEYGGAVKISRYWALSPDSEPDLRPPRECEEAFTSIFMQAVGDRVREKSVALELSGGMDSGAIAVALSELLQERPFDILTHTNISPKLMPNDREGEFATLTARHLGLHHQLWLIDSPPFYRWLDTDLATAEPVGSIDLASSQELMAHLNNRGIRVLLTGQLGDALFAGQNYYRRLAKQGRMLHIAREVWRAARYKGSLRGLGLRSSLLGIKSTSAWRPELPRWLKEGFANEVNAQQRWVTCWESWENANGLGGQFSAGWLPSLFEGYNTLKMPIVTRHPFSDIRLLEFMLNVPNAEVIGKKLLRETLGKKLPPEVRCRAKTPLNGDPVREQLADKHFRQQASTMLEHVEDYVNTVDFNEVFNDFCAGAGVESTWSSVLMATPLALDFWLKTHKK
ncbi:MAG: asparagine synthase-related protein [Porticoccaceae bacterium]|nr:asparagine synthase-related protein [Porticoccaceae bacterium]